MVAGRAQPWVRVWVLSLLLCLTISPAPGDGQERFRVHGYIQWIAADAMQLQTDGGPSISLDLSQVDQSSYQGLPNGKGVTVTGVVIRPQSSGQGASLIAESIVADP
jgi:hypothetical protein